MPKFIILRPDGTREERDLPETEPGRLQVLQAAVGGSIEYLSPAFHGLQNYEVVVNEDGYGRLPRNEFGCALIGFDLARFEALYGPIVLVSRRFGGVSNAAEREAHETFFALLSRVASGELPPRALRRDFVIDAREE